MRNRARPFPRPMGTTTRRKDHVSSLGAWLPWSRFLMAAGALILCWLYLSRLAPEQVASSKSRLNDVVLFMSHHSKAFALVLWALLIPGVVYRHSAERYYTYTAVLVLVLVAAVAWDITSPATQFTELVNGVLNESLWDRSFPGCLVSGTQP